MLGLMSVLEGKFQRVMLWTLKIARLFDSIWATIKLPNIRFV